jgi:hypothetical protein
MFCGYDMGRWPVIASVRIIGRVSQRAQFPLHHRLRHHERMAPLRLMYSWIRGDSGYYPANALPARRARWDDFGAFDEASAIMTLGKSPDRMAALSCYPDRRFGPERR